MALVTNDLLDAYDMSLYGLLTVQAATKRRTPGSAEKRFQELKDAGYYQRFEKQNGCPAFYFLQSKMVTELKEYLARQTAAPSMMPRLKTKRSDFPPDGIRERQALLNFCHKEVKDGCELRRLIRQSQIHILWLKASNTKVYHYEPTTDAIHCLIASKSDKVDRLYERCLDDFQKRLEVPGDQFLHAYVKGRFHYTLLVPYASQRQKFEELLEERGFPDPETIYVQKVPPAERDLFQVAVEPVLSPPMPTSPNRNRKKRGSN